MGTLFKVRSTSMENVQRMVEAAGAAGWRTSDQLRCTPDQSSTLSYLHIKRESVFFEGEEVENQLLPTFGERRQVAVTVHVDGLALENLQG